MNLKKNAPIKIKSKFLISEAAKKFHTSRSTLLYYDKIGLLTPLYDHENGYRYYSYNELEKLELILTLKESGLSLENIGRFLDNPSHESSIDLLSNQKSKIRDKINELEKLEIILDRRIDLLNEYQNVEIYSAIKLDFYPKISICKVDFNHDNSNPFEEAIFKLKDILDSSITSYGSITSKYAFCIDPYRLANNEINPYKYVFDYLGEYTDQGHTLEIEESYVLRCIHFGSYDEISKTIDKLENYINVHGYKQIGEIFLIPLLDLWNTDSSDDYKSEVLIPVEI